ncbi:hypothetical protein OIU78_029539 [Salix suchowensis]|nr:hypothetical protein OIU78_029539 [Salix suchowensis]
MKAFTLLNRKEDAIMISPFLLLEMLENCYGMENLRLCSEKLKRLGLSSFYTAERELYLELDCPNLVWLGIDCVETGEFCIKNLSSLIEFRTSIAHKTEHYGHWFKVVKQLHRIAHIKHLVVQNWWRKVWIVLRVTGEMDYLKVEEGLRILFPSLLRNVEISRAANSLVSSEIFMKCFVHRPNTLYILKVTRGQGLYKFRMGI